MFHMYVLIFSLHVSALGAALSDSNILVLRACLDIASLLFPLHTTPLSRQQISLLLTSALQCLLKRDVSLNRRLYAWLLGTNASGIVDSHTDADSKSTDTRTSKAYFITYVQKSFLLSVSDLLEQALAWVTVGDKNSCVLPYRILRVLLEKDEVADSVPLLLSNVTSCLKDQMELLRGAGSGQTGFARQFVSGFEIVQVGGGGGGGRKGGKKALLRSEVLSCALQLLVAMEEEVWKWMEKLLVDSLHSAIREEKEEKEEEEEKEKKSLTDVLALVEFTVDVLPLVCVCV